MTSIGIRELRQHASQYLRRVREGETITITDRGEPVAEIRPVDRGGSIRDRLIAEGRMRPARGDLQEFLRLNPPAAPNPGDPTLTDVLLQMRDEERY